MSENMLHVIGVSPEGLGSLSPDIQRLILNADMLVGGQRLLDMFPSFIGEKITVGSNLAEIVKTIKNSLSGKKIIVLASGDPGFFGIGKYLVDKLGQDNVKIIPNVSSVQLAFARIGENWDGAALVSVHSRPIEDIIGIIRSENKIAILTDPKNTPSKIASILIKNGVPDYMAYVCQNIGMPDERIVRAALPDIVNMEFALLNIVILKRIPTEHAVTNKAHMLFGIPDSEFVQPTEGHLITKQEVRAISLAKMAISSESVVWDIGAGSGAVSVETALLAKAGYVYAIEKNIDFIPVIQQNIKKFGCQNVKVINAKAPQTLDELPQPDVVFIGGSAGKMNEILQFCCKTLRVDGRIVINAATFDTLNKAIEGLKKNGFEAEISLASVSRSKKLLDSLRLESLNPIFVIAGKRREE